MGLIACGNTVVHAHITYVLKSCCFSLSLFNLFTLCLSADLPSVPFSLLICTIPSSFLPPVERTACGAQRQKKARQAQDLTERIQRPPGPVEQPHKHTLPLENRESTSHTHAPAHTDRVTHILIFFISPPNLLYSCFDLTSFHFSFPQVLPLSLCPLMSSKMTSPPAPPRPTSNMAFTNHRPSLRCQGCQVTN